MKTASERMQEAETTRERVRLLVEAHPEYTQSDLARELDVSRERIRQIVNSEGLVVKRWRRRGVGERVRLQPSSRTGGVSVPISHTVAGTIGELMAAADLTARGFVVFFPLVRTAACDLITLDRQGRMERIEVRCGHRGYKDRIVYAQKDKSRADRYAVVVTGEPIAYDPPF